MYHLPGLMEPHWIEEPKHDMHICTFIHGFTVQSYPDLHSYVCTSFLLLEMNSAWNTLLVVNPAQAHAYVSQTFTASAPSPAMSTTAGIWR